MLRIGIGVLAAASDAFNITAPFIIVIIVLASILLILAGVVIYTAVKSPAAFKWLGDLARAVKGSIAGAYAKLLKSRAFNQLISPTGFEYDREQDIYYSRLDAWQRKLGYCRLYDETAPLTGMILDSEPVYFDYKGKRWLIELWKGQYDLTTGFEIGVYNTDRPDLDVPGIFSGTLYDSAKDDELLLMSCTLLKNNKILFKRQDRQWWLTGFKVGEFSNPSELTMYVSITLKDEAMVNAFVEGLEDIQYAEREIHIKGNTVSFIFSKPHSLQPYSRTKEIEAMTQWKNEILCDAYNDLTKDLNNSPQKIQYIRKNESDMYQKIADIGKSMKKFDMYKTIKNYLD